MAMFLMVVGMTTLCALGAAVIMYGGWAVFRGVEAIKHYQRVKADRSELILKVRDLNRENALLQEKVSHLLSLNPYRETPSLSIHQKN